MHFDLALILVLLTAASGLIWLIDSRFFAAARQRDARPGEPAKLPVLVDYARSFFPVLLIVLLVRSFLAEPFRIPSSSMMPTLHVGDFILVNKFTYGIRLPVLNRKIIDLGAPERGDVVVFRFPQDPRLDYIKRVVGLPGDEVSYRNHVLYINGEEVPKTFVSTYVGQGNASQATGHRLYNEEVGEAPHQVLVASVLPQNRGREGNWTVPEGHYFVLGDNRNNSQDSRYWGMVPEQNLVGRAFLVWFSWDAGVNIKRIGTSIK